MGDAPHIETIDVHHHVGNSPLTGAAHMAGSDGADAPDEVASRLEQMDLHGVDRCVIIPGHGYLRPDGIADTRRVNDDVASYRDAHPDRFAAALGIVEPVHGDAGAAELHRIKHELGLRGVSFHCRFQGVSNDHPLVRALVAEMAALELVPFFHVYPESPDESPIQLIALAGDFPDTTFVVMNGFGGVERRKEIGLLAASCPNTVFDTSAARDLRPIRSFVDEFGAGRVLFGSDTPSFRVGYDATMAAITNSTLSVADRQAILSGNARRVLGLA